VHRKLSFGRVGTSIDISGIMFRSRFLPVGLVLGFSVGFMGLAKAATAFSFREWKYRQIVEAQNRRVRAENHLRLLMKGPHWSDDLRQREISLRADLRRAEDATKMSHSLTLQDYFEAYLRPLATNGSQIRLAAAKMTKAEVAELVSWMLKHQDHPGAYREALAPQRANRLKYL